MKPLPTSHVVSLPPLSLVYFLSGERCANQIHRDVGGNGDHALASSLLANKVMVGSSLPIWFGILLLQTTRKPRRQHHQAHMHRCIIVQLPPVAVRSLILLAVVMLFMMMMMKIVKNKIHSFHLNFVIHSYFFNTRLARAAVEEEWVVLCWGSGEFNGGNECSE